MNLMVEYNLRQKKMINQLEREREKKSCCQHFGGQEIRTYSIVVYRLFRFDNMRIYTTQIAHTPGNYFFFHSKENNKIQRMLITCDRDLCHREVYPEGSMQKNKIH